eukprot:3821695-Pleurochrysis_carterae.AAC.2
MQVRMSWARKVVAKLAAKAWDLSLHLASGSVWATDDTCLNNLWAQKYGKRAAPSDSSEISMENGLTELEIDQKSVFLFWLHLWIVPGEP